MELQKSSKISFFISKLTAAIKISLHAINKTIQSKLMLEKESEIGYMEIEKCSEIPIMR